MEQPLHVASLGWMPSTPEGGLEGEVVFVRDLSPDKIAAQLSLKGRIALLPDGEPYGRPYDRTRERQNIDARLRDAGVIAILSPDTDAGNVLSARWRGFSADRARCRPRRSAATSADDPDAREGHGPRRDRLQNRSRRPGHRPNVVAKFAAAKSG